MSNTITLWVPENFENPIPHSWSAEDCALVLQLGISALNILKKDELDKGDHDKVFATLRQIISSDQENIRKDNERLQKERDEMNECMIRQQAKLENIENELRLEHKLQHERLLEEKTSSMRESIVNLEHQLRSSTQSLEISMRTTSDISTQKDLLQKEKDELTKRLAENDRVKTSNESGSSNEENTKVILQEGGLFVRDTSKGTHNLHYHDKLVSLEFIQKDDTNSCIPMYKTDAKVICSLEDKCYKHSNKLGPEIEKFLEIRKAMQIGKRADCFVWYSTTTIPRYGHKRKSFQYEQLEDGRFCVTGWIGADDISEEELVMFVQEVIDQQKCLMDLKTTLPLENDTIQNLTTTSEYTMKLAKAQLAQVDKMTVNIKELEQQRDGIRCTALEMILRQYATLKEHNLLSKSDHVLNDSLMSLNNEKRTEADKFIKNKDEFLHLQVNMKGSSSANKKRKV
jgi:hypothetical protein